LNLPEELEDKVSDDEKPNKEEEKKAEVVQVKEY
jgi:hypothetical protein